MNALLTAITFLLILCVIVVVHEGGHTMIARLCGMRVTEFFVGMPWGPAATHVSKRTGICYGATFALFGGYTRITGMSYVNDERLAFVLALVNARGMVAPEELALVLACDVDEAVGLLELLADLGSVERLYEQGKRRHPREMPCDYVTPDRDDRGLTVRDRGNALREGVAHPGCYPFDPQMSAEDFLAQELSHTYKGASFLRRVFVLVAGVFFNLLFAFALLTACYCSMPLYSAYLGVSEVTDGEAAQAAGVQAGDRLSALDGQDVSSFESTDALSEALASSEVLTFSRQSDGEDTQIEVTKSDDKFGVLLKYEYSDAQYLDLATSAQCSLSYIGTVATSVLSLLNPQQAGETLSQSSGVVGIAAMTSTAVSSGVLDVLVLLAALSVSLAWMNLLPIPPLDGGKLLIEVIERVIGREVPAWIQGALSLLGIGIVLLLFVYMVFQDASRLF